MRLARFIAALLISHLAGLIGSFYTYPSIKSWYAILAKPVFTPPNWVFAPVWTLLFFLMGIALFLVWEKGTEKEEVRAALLFFGIQLFLNVTWSILFFGLRAELFAFIEIIFLWAAILITILKFSRVSKAAAYLMAPYLLWVSFAAFLNFSIYWLNR